MTNHATILRSLIIYGICLPLAIFLGYLLTNTDSLDNLKVIGVLLAILLIPILLRFHFVLLIMSWNISVVLFFLPGRPSLCLALSVISFMICIGHRTMDKRFHFLSVPEISRPLIILGLIVWLTAEATGGIGIKAMGSDVYGGKRYLLVFGTIMGYFALTSRRIPVERAGFYLALFFLPGLISFLSDWYVFSGPFTRYLYLLLPPTVMTEAEFGVTRFGGLSAGASVLFSYLLARYGIKGIFTGGRPWRFGLFIMTAGISLLGGYRSVLITLILVFTFQFFLEGLHRTKLLPIFAFTMVAAATFMLPFMERMPMTIQRSFAFVPYLPIDPEVRSSAQDSSDWRINMWKAAIPEIPKYLLIGKGYALSAQDFSFATDPNLVRGGTGEDWWGAFVAGDYHNGPLSVILTFGLAGMLVFVWLIVGGFRVLYNNYRYGDPSLKTINTFLFAYYATRTIMFFVVVGSFSNDLITFLGLIGLGIGFNGGMARASKMVPEPVVKADNFAGLLPRPKSAFSR